MDTSPALTTHPDANPNTLPSELADIADIIPLGAPSPRRRTGKIARLPKHLRDRLNAMLDDGLPYAEIIRALGPDASHLTADNLSQWKHGGYQDWLNQQDHRFLLSASLELTASLSESNDRYVLLDQITRAALIRINHLLLQVTDDAGNQNPDKSWLRTLSHITRLVDTSLKLGSLRASQAALQRVRPSILSDLIGPSRTSAPTADSSAAPSTNQPTAPSLMPTSEPSAPEPAVPQPIQSNPHAPPANSLPVPDAAAVPGSSESHEHSPQETLTPDVPVGRSTSLDNPSDSATAEPAATSTMQTQPAPLSSPAPTPVQRPPDHACPVCGKPVYDPESMHCRRCNGYYSEDEPC